MVGDLVADDMDDLALFLKAARIAIIDANNDNLGSNICYGLRPDTRRIATNRCKKGFVSPPHMAITFCDHSVFTKAKNALWKGTVSKQWRRKLASRI
ncbi:hypothetical protein WG907_06470 [Sphingobium sp. AN558]|uniref:hypothetical protein n=1 Tax=Sphingobium sp. AN558 TaxID=3133442 RepID=UPI0030C2ED10